MVTREVRLYDPVTMAMIGTREYTSDRMLRMDAAQYGWTRVASDGYVVRDGDQERFAGRTEAGE